MAKTIYNMPTTRALLDRLEADSALRRICGWERKSDVPDEWTFSRAFAEFSASQLPERVHGAFIKKSDKLEIHYTPKHGSWLNMAEIELSILSRQWLDRRIPDQETLRMEIAAWQEQRNAIAQPMEWRFTNEDARVKLKKLYPTIQN